MSGMVSVPFTDQSNILQNSIYLLTDIDAYTLDVKVYGTLAIPGVLPPHIILSVTHERDLTPFLNQSHSKGFNLLCHVSCRSPTARFALQLLKTWGRER